jgi:NAD-dependent DNA ligase
LNDNSAYYNRLNLDRLVKRQVDELIGLAKGITADGILSDDELSMLVHWLVANREITHDPLVAGLYRQIQSMLADGVLTAAERAELLDVLRGYASPGNELGEPMLSTAIPYSAPPILLGFAGWRYCFTGTFNYGTRDQCEAAVTSRGASAGTSVTKQTDALVVGQYATESWLHSPYGLKIIKAARMRNEGHRILIVSEEAWTSALM